MGQVHAAMRDEPASASGRSNLVANGHANGGSHPHLPLAEGAETALLYVRFRAAAEPGLKGMLCSSKAKLCYCHWECQNEGCTASHSWMWS